MCNRAKFLIPQTMNIPRPKFTLLHANAWHELSQNNLSAIQRRIERRMNGNAPLIP